MSNEEEQTLIVCGPWSPGAPEGQDVECTECKTKLYLCDSSLRSVRQNSGKSPDELGIVILCLDCAIVLLNERADTQILPPTEEQIEEIKQVLKTEKDEGN